MSCHLCAGLRTIMLRPTSSSTTTATTTPLPRTLPYSRTPRSTWMYGTTRPPWMSRIPRCARMHGTYGTNGTDGCSRLSRSPGSATASMSPCLYPLLYENLSTAVLQCSPSPDYASSPTTPSSNANLCTVLCTSVLHGQEVNNCSYKLTSQASGWEKVIQKTLWSAEWYRKIEGVRFVSSGANVDGGQFHTQESGFVNYVLASRTVRANKGLF